MPIISQKGSPGGGSSAYPATPAGATTGTLTDPIRGSGTTTWVKYPSDGTVLAWGIAGDAFPRVVFGADPTDDGVVMLGDGTYDPIASGAYIYGGTPNGAGKGTLTIGSPTGQFTAGEHDTNVGAYNRSTEPIQIDGLLTLIAGIGDPNGPVGANLGDLYLDQEGHPPIWRCTVAGVPGAAVFVPYQAVFVDPTTATAGQIATALINAGLMASS